MKRSVRFDAMEAAARQHAQLDKTTAVLWEEEADICAKLKVVDGRLKVLRLNSASSTKPKDRPKASVGERRRLRRVPAGVVA